MPTLMESTLDELFPQDTAPQPAQPLRGPQGAVTSSTGSATSAEAAPVTVLTEKDAEQARRPEDPAESHDEAGSTVPSTVATVAGGGSSTSGSGGGTDEAEPARVQRAARPVGLTFDDKGVKQVREVPVALLERLQALAVGRADKLEQLSIKSMSVSKLVTAFVAVKLGIRPDGVDKQTARLMELFASLDPEREALEQRVEALTTQVRRQRKEQQADRQRARAVERGVAILVAERLEPTPELLGLAHGSVTRPSHITAERLLRAEAVHLVQADVHAEGVRSQ